MATSGSYNYKPNRNKIIERALRIVQAIGQGETPAPDMYTEANDTLNDIISALLVDGLILTSVKLGGPFTMVDGTSSYTVGTGSTWAIVTPNKILQAFVRDTNTDPDYDQPVQIITREEYMALPSKFQESTRPTHLWYDPNRINSSGALEGTVYLWPVPDSTAATNCRMYFTYSRPLQDFDSSTDDLDLPQEWFRAVIWLLAADIAYEYGLPFAERSMIAKRAQEAHSYALLNSSQEGSMYLQPEPRWYRLDR